MHQRISRFADKALGGEMAVMRALMLGMIIIINTGIGICTELKAKRTLDKLSILVASAALAGCTFKLSIWLFLPAT